MNAFSQVSFKMTRQEFEYFRSRIYDLAGISLSDAKLDLLQARLRSHVTSLGMRDFNEYQNYLDQLPKSHGEWEAFINLLTTNKTDWFREPAHFTFLTNEFLPKWLALKKKHLTVWCAASSTGEEPYTLSLVLNHALKNTGVTFEILATDIDTEVLKVAKNGVYPRDRLDQIPDVYHKRFLPGTGAITNWMKVGQEIKAPLQFEQFNLAKFPYPMDKQFDIVFCRNVLIYFNQQTIRDVVENMYKITCKDSVLIIAHSESLQNIKVSWKYVRPSIYTKGKIL